VTETLAMLNRFALSRFCNMRAHSAFSGLRSLREIVVGSCVRK
jgi:hypothetical protein